MSVLKKNRFFQGYLKGWRTHPFIHFSFHIFFVIAFFSRMLVGYVPWYAEYKGEKHLLLWDDQIPAGSELQSALLKSQYNWKSLSFERAIYPLITLSGSKYRPESAWLPPLSQDSEQIHLLGTWDLGRDIFMSLIVGIQKSLVIALVSIVLGMIWGIPTGVLLAYHKFSKKTVSLFSMIILIILMIVLVYLLIIGIELRYLNYFYWSVPFVLVLFLLSINSITAGPLIRLNSDFWLMRFIEFGKSVPMILLVLIILQLAVKPGMWVLALIMSFYLALNFAKYARFTTHSLSQNNYMESVNALGYPDYLIVTGYLIPSVLQGIGPVVALSIAHVVLLESALSYLGLGLPVEEVTLGGIMQSARNYPYAWWAVVFPGLCIFWIIYCFQTLDDSMSTRFADQGDSLS